MADQTSAGAQAMNALKLVANVAILPGAGQDTNGIRYHHGPAAFQ
jgi:hypothetical protein